jgi:MFS family permease
MHPRITKPWISVAVHPRTTRPWILVAIALFAVGWGANQFSPMLLVYRAQLHLSAGDLGLLFALYAVGLIPGLLVGGPASDHFGRRRLVLPFVALSPVATALTLLSAHAPVALGGARFLAGVCSGVVFAAGGAWLQELSAGAAPGAAARRATIAMSAGFGAGPLVASLLAQFAPDPLRFPYLPHLALGLAAVLVVARVPETVSTGGDGPFLRLPSTARLPRFRRAVVPLAPWVFGSAALAMVVLPALVTTAHSASVAFAGITTAVTAGMGVLAQPLARSLEDRRRLGAAAAGLAIAVGALLLGLVATIAQSQPLVILAAVPLGMAYGMCLVAGLRETERLAPANERGASIAVFLAITYIGFGAPYAFDVLQGAIGARTSLVVLAALAAITAMATPVQRLHRARVSGRSGAQATAGQ